MAAEALSDKLFFEAAGFSDVLSLLGNSAVVDAIFLAGEGGDVFSVRRYSRQPHYAKP